MKSVVKVDGKHTKKGKYACDMYIVYWLIDWLINLVFLLLCLFSAAQQLKRHVEMILCRP